MKLIGLPGHPYAAGIGPSGVWVRGPGRLWRIDPTSIPLPSSNAGTGQPDGDIAVTDDSVWVSDPAATSDTRLLGLGGSEVRGPRRNLHELNTDRITTVAAADDAGTRPRSRMAD